MQGCTFLLRLHRLCPSSLEKERKQLGIPGEDFWRQQNHLLDFRTYQNLRSLTSRL